MPPAARVTDPTTHGAPLSPGPGSTNVMIGGMPAWRAMIDQHACPAASVSGADGVGSVLKGSPTVLINDQMACRQLDIVVEKPGLAMGPANPILLGCPTVMIGDAGTPAMPGLTPLFGQETPMSCGMGTSRMVIATVTGRTIPEVVLRSQSQAFPGSYSLANGTQMSNMSELLRLNGVKNASDPKTQTIDDLQKATAGGDPAIVHFNNPGGGGHFMVVDGVTTNADGTKTLQVRDPWPPGSGTSSNMSDKQFKDRGYNDLAITTNP